MINTRFAFTPTVVLAVVTVGLMAVPSGPAQACGPESFIGSVCFTAAYFCPDGMYTLTNSLPPVQINSDRDTYSVIGNLYGSGKGASFGLPDLSGAALVGSGTGSGGLASAELGERRGSADGILRYISQIPAHTHEAEFNVEMSLTEQELTLKATSDSGLLSTPPENAVMAGAARAMWAPALTSPVVLEGTSAAIGGGFKDGKVENAVTGQSKPFNIEPPSVVLTACMPGGGSRFPKPN